MGISRRSFFKRSMALGTSGFVAAAPSLAHAAADTAKKPYKLVSTQEFTNICCYCAGGCGVICSVRNGELVNLEGDPDHPVNKGGLCPKGATMFNLRNVVTPDRKVKHNESRLLKPQVRRPGSDKWEDISWEDAFNEIARHVKKTRDENFVEYEDGVLVNRNDGMASIGAAQLQTEEAWLVQKFCRSLGSVQIDNQTRPCHSSPPAGFAPTFGRGSMTSHWCDIENADVVMSIGSNSVESHPLSSRYIERAQRKGGTWIVVDPRYTRSAAQADLYACIRPGTDIAFFGGMMNYILSNNLWQDEYVKNYTNAPCLINPDFKFDPESGHFTGYNPDTHKYDDETWSYQTASDREWDTKGAMNWVTKPGVPKFKYPTVHEPKKDMTLQDPNCVFQIMKRHYSRYTLDKVSSVTGIDKEVLEKVYQVYTSTGKRERVGTILYALGETQHTFGSQNCRSMAVIQLLLGNVGVPGGGVNALRGEPNVQGSTDIAATSDGLPGYLNYPRQDKHAKLADWLAKETYADGYYTNKPKFMVSILKEWYGENATVENDYGYDWMPKLPHEYRDASMIPTWNRMRDGKVKGYFVWGMNPAHFAPNASNARRGLAKLDWMVVSDIVPTETSDFWKEPGFDVKSCKTEIYRLPAALIYERPGSIVNSGRMLQWREQAVPPLGQAKWDLEMMSEIFTRVQDLYRKEGGKCPEAVTKVNWDYKVDGKWSMERVARALNGYNTVTGKFLKTYGDLQADGTSACGCWIYVGYWNNDDAPLDHTKQPVYRRGTEDPSGLGVFPNWAWVWPANRRILYNRGAADMKGQPWNPKRDLLHWDEKAQKWVCYDVPDFVAAKDGKGVPPNNKAFMMTWEQYSRLFPNHGMADGPLPEHYEPWESPVKNQINGSQNNPCAIYTNDPSVKRADPDKFPIVATTYSVVEHWQAGGQTRNCPWLVEISPRPFVEMSEELAKEKGIKNKDLVRVWNNRGEVRVQAMVTKRLKPVMVDGKPHHILGCPHHFSFIGRYASDRWTMNDLTPNVGDPNSQIPEYRGFLVNVEKA